jgi:hypothetical protein
MRKHRITTLAALTLAAATITASPAGADGGVYSERAGDAQRKAHCAAWESAMAKSLALYGITGSSAASYLRARADNPCGVPMGPRSLFHAGDPGKA